MTPRKVERCIKCNDALDHREHYICPLCGCGFWCACCLGEHQIDCETEHGYDE